jgi:plastocyanin
MIAVRSLFGGFSMRVRLVLPFVAIAIAACGSDSTAPKPAHTEDISITNDGFIPEVDTVQTNTLVTWTVTAGDDSHVIRFTGDIPQGGNPNSGTLTLNQKASTTFLQTGTFTYEDSLHTSHTGVIVVQ